jgi:hypothetical protein
MIFVSYSHADEKWRKGFEIISKPLSRSEGMRFWSDRDLKAGEWEPQIENAMKDAIAAVLLVSDNFLASDYIIDKELPFLLRAHKTRDLMIFWAYLEPCDLKRYPEITRFQAMSTGNLEPMSKLTEWQWKEIMVRGCGMIDEFLKGLERPSINPAVAGKSFPKLIERFPLLAKPARRDGEVLVYDGTKWWRQARVKSGMRETRIHLGTDQTKKGTKFTGMALTCERPLTQQTYPNLPDHRTKAEFTLIRG